MYQFKKIAIKQRSLRNINLVFSSVLYFCHTFLLVASSSRIVCSINIFSSGGVYWVFYHFSGAFTTLVNVACSSKNYRYEILAWKILFFKPQSIPLLFYKGISEIFSRRTRNDYHFYSNYRKNTTAKYVSQNITVVPCLLSIKLE